MTVDPDDPRLTAFALGALEEPERSAVERQVAADPEAQRLVEEIRRTAATLSEALKSEPSPGLSIVQRLELESRIQEREPRIRRQSRLGILLAASVLIGLVGFGLGRTTSPRLQVERAGARSDEEPTVAFTQPREPEGVLRAPAVESSAGLAEGRVAERSGSGASSGASESPEPDATATVRDRTDLQDSNRFETPPPAASAFGGGAAEFAAPAETKPGTDSPAAPALSERNPARTPARPELDAEQLGQAGEGEDSGFADYEAPAIRGRAAERGERLDPSNAETLGRIEAGRRMRLGGRVAENEAAERRAESEPEDVNDRFGMGRGNIVERTRENQDTIGPPEGPSAGRSPAEAIEPLMFDATGRVSAPNFVLAAQVNASSAFFTQKNLQEKIQNDEPLEPARRHFFVAEAYPVANGPLEAAETPGPIVPLIRRVETEGLPIDHPTSIYSLIQAAGAVGFAPGSKEADAAPKEADDAQDLEPVALRLETSQAPWNLAHQLVVATVAASEPIAQTSLEVEFNPERVARYRWIGFEGGTPLDPAEPPNAPVFGALQAGETALALFELEPRAADRNLSMKRLKYQALPINDQARRELLTASVLYRVEGAEELRRLTGSVESEAAPRPIERASEPARLAAAAAWLGFVLNGEAEDPAAALPVIERLVRSIDASAFEPQRPVWLRLIAAASARLADEPPKEPEAAPEPRPDADR